MTEEEIEALPPAKRRAAKNRIASRNYRQRKRQYINQLEAELEDMRMENERLREHAEGEVNVKMLKEENEALKVQLERLRKAAEEEDVSDEDRMGLAGASSSSSKKPLSNEEQQIQMVEELHRNVIDNAPEHVIARNLAKLRQLRTPQEITTADVVRQLEHDTNSGSIASPLPGPTSTGVSEALAAMATTIGTDAAGEEEEKEEGGEGGELVEAQKFSVANYLALDTNQQSVINALRETHQTKMNAIVKERNEINQHLRSLLQDKIGLYTSLKAQKVDFGLLAKAMPEVAEIGTTLARLRDNIQAEAEATEYLVNQFRAVLTPRQEAVWELRVCQFSHCRTRVIQALWTVAENASLTNLPQQKCDPPAS